MRKIKQRVVSALVFSRDGKLLMGKKPPNPSAVYLDCWHIPGGVVDKGDDISALHREVLEETGIRVDNYHVELVDDLGRGEATRTLLSGEKVLCEMEFLVYKVDIADKNAYKIKTAGGDDLENLTWFALSELEDLNLTPPSQSLFKRLGYMK